MRADFPILTRSVSGRALIYFDNAATTQRPRQVIEAVARFYEEHNANVHRGLHTLSQEASELYEEAHEVLAKFVGASGMEEVAFLAGTTDALNAVADGWACRHLAPGDRIVTTVLEHHSNMLPWRRAAQRTGAEIVYVDVTERGLLRWDQLENAIDERTRLVAITGMSNVTGQILDVSEVAKLAHEVDAVLVVDGAQAVPHLPMDVRAMGVDFLAFSGHKMLGPTGIGVLYGRRDLLEEMDPPRVGGGMISDVTLEGAEWADLPWRLEAGTPHIAGAVGLAEAARYLMRLGMEAVREHERRLTDLTLRLLGDRLPDEVVVYGPTDVEERGGIVTFNVRGLDPHMTASLLDSFGIAVRSGLHCAHPLHRRMGAPEGTVRASFYVYNTEEEVRTFVDALSEIAETAG